MKDHEVNRMTDAMQSCLDGGASGLPEEVAAAQYAQECRVINERLARIAMMLESAGEMEALQVSEAEPRLVDRAVLLSFGGEDDWKEYCRDHGYETAPDLDVASLEALEKIYARNISPKHPLYKDYRAAVHSRDEPKAYELIKIITRLNPSDANAKRELQRLEHKVVMRLLGELKVALQAEDEASMLRCLGEIESTRNREEYEDASPYQSAVELRDIIRRKETKAAIPKELADADEQLGEGGDWLKAARIYAETEAKLDRYGITLTSEQEIIHKRTHSKLDEFRREAERNAKTRQISESLRQIAEDVELSAVTPDGLDPEFAARTLEQLLKCQRKLHDLRADLQAGDRTRVEAARGQLEQVLERKRRSKKIKFITMSSVAASVLLLAAAYGWLLMQASDRVEQLVQLEKDGQSKALKKQVESIRESDSILLRFSNVAAQLTISEQWLKGVQSSTDKIDGVLDSMESEATLKFVNSDPIDVHKRMKELDELADKLPQDVRTELETRLIIIRNDSDRYLAAWQKVMAGKANAVLAKLEERLKTCKLTGAAIESKQVLDGSLELLEPFLTMSEQEAYIRRLPASVETSMRDIDARLRKLIKKIEDTLAALQAVEKASSVDEYSRAIAHLAEQGFAEARMAQQVEDGVPDERRIRAALLFRGDLAALAATEKVDLSSLMVPKTADRKDRDAIRDLYSNPSLVNLYKVRWTSNGRMQPVCYSQGKLEILRSDGRVLKWSGPIARVPDRRGREPSFKTMSIYPHRNSILTENSLSATSHMMDSLGLDFVMNDTGTMYRQSIISLVDTVYKDRNAPSLAKAYVLNTLFGLLRGREYEWGLQFVPGLVKDMEIARELELQFFPKDCDWLYAKPTKDADMWKEYFSARMDRDYYRHLRVTQSLYQKGISAPIKLAGVVKPSGVAALIAADDPRVLLALCLDSKRTVKLRVIGEVRSQDRKFSVPADVLPLSPLFSLKLNNESELQAVLKIHGLEKK